MKTIILAVLIIAAGSQIPSAPPHADDSPEKFRKWVSDVMKGCKKQEWRDKDSTRDEFCRRAAEALANLYLEEHPELLK